MFALADGGDAPVALPGCCKHRRCKLREKEAGDGLPQETNSVIIAAISNEAPPEQFCPSELVQLGPWASRWIEDALR